MRKFYLLLLLAVGLPLIGFSQTPAMADGNYVVVAAFSPHHEDYAQRMANKLSGSGKNAKYGFDANRKYWYVYTFQSPDHEICKTETIKLRSESAFSDAWTHSISKGESKDERPVVQEVVKEEQTREEPKVEVSKPVPTVTDVIPNPPANPVFEPQNLDATPVFLSLFNATNNEVQEGEVEVIDPEKSKLLARVKGNEYLTLPNPGTKSGRLLLISSVFGYRKEELEVNYKNTEADTLKPYVLLVGDFYMINFSLVRIHKGDISTLYNVYFFNDAAIMLPSSQYQLTSLLKLMTENPKMKIILHGHTNGGGSGKIIYMGPSKNFFAMTKDVKNDYGSAKELSLARAETIKEWLMSQGITEDRISVKGWGGSKIIYDKDSMLARKNIRVDVEVAEE